MSAVHSQHARPSLAGTHGPYLCFLGALLHIAALEDAVEFETAILIHGRVRVHGQATLCCRCCRLWWNSDGLGRLLVRSRVGGYRQGRQLRLHFSHDGAPM